jgi:hypothetical protein
MASSEPSIHVTLPARHYDVLAGFLSYLIPGLGQIHQGRTAKGILFFVCLYSLFFFGMFLGNWQNVYIWTPEGAEQARTGEAFKFFTDNARYLGQFCIGVAAWPSVIQHLTYNRNADGHPLLGQFQRMPAEKELNNQLRREAKGPDLGWVYTVIAGVLNILVIYDAFAGPACMHPMSGRAEKDGPREEEEPAT